LTDHLTIDVTARVLGAPEGALPLHAAVVHSIRRGDGQAAEAAMRTLILTTAREINRGLYMTASPATKGE
jgi:DNA-binding FadR family transcriptional regulator